MRRGLPTEADEAWPKALDELRSQAASLGAHEVYGYVDEPGNDDLAIFKQADI